MFQAKHFKVCSVTLTKRGLVTTFYTVLDPNILIQVFIGFTYLVW